MVAQQAELLAQGKQARGRSEDRPGSQEAGVIVQRMPPLRVKQLMEANLQSVNLIEKYTLKHSDDEDHRLVGPNIQAW